MSYLDGMLKEKSSEQEMTSRYSSLVFAKQVQTRDKGLKWTVNLRPDNLIR